jgi:hypothetical protein
MFEFEQLFTIFKACCSIAILGETQLTGQNPDLVFNSRSAFTYSTDFYSYEAKRTNLKLKTWPKQLLGLEITLPNFAFG